MGYLLCNDHHHGYVKFHCISVQPWQRDGNHNLVKWPKDVSLGYLVRERFVCKERNCLPECFKFKDFKFPLCARKRQS